MKISTNLPFASRVNSIPGGNYVVLAAVGLLAVVAAIFLKKKWDIAMFERFISKCGIHHQSIANSRTDPKLRRLFTNIFASTEQASESRLECVQFSNKEPGGKVILGSSTKPFLKIINNEIFEQAGKWDGLYVSTVAASQMRWTQGGLFWVEGNALIKPTGQVTFFKFPARDKIVSFDCDFWGHNVAIATKNEVIGYGLHAEETFKFSVHEKIISVHFYKGDLIVVTEDGIFFYDCLSKDSQEIATVKGILSTKICASRILIMESENKLEMCSLGSGGAYPPISKPFSGAALFEHAEGFTFIAPKEGNEIYLCSRHGNTISKLQVPEKIQDLRFEDNKLYIAGETQGFIWNFNK